MTFSLILVLLVLMVTGGGRGRIRGSRGTSKRTRTAEESDGSDLDYQDSSAEEAEETVARPNKEKGVAGESSRGGGSYARKRRAKRMAEIPPERVRAFSARSCIAERHVNFKELTEQVPEFGRLLLRAPIEPVGHVAAHSPFCVELIREFYMRGIVLVQDEETETFIFETTVRGKKMAVTPYDIGELLGMEVDTSGLHYTAGTFQSSTHWETVIEAICKAGVRTNRAVVESKDLRPEYHLLSLILCYNVQPTIGTKRIRWNRLVLLYFLGHPEQTYGLNVNIPFLIWQRMVHVIQSSLRRDLLPFSLLITRILRGNGVDTRCEKYDFGLGSIDAVTWAKSVSTLKTFQQIKTPPPHAASSSAARSPPPPSRHAEREIFSSSRGVVTLDSLHREVGSLKKGFKRLEQGIKRILEKMGCRHDDIFPQTTHSTYQRSAFRQPFLSSSIDAFEAGGSGSYAEGDDDDDEATE